MHRKIDAYTLLFAFAAPLLLQIGASQADKNTRFVKQQILAKKKGVTIHPETGDRIDIGGGHIIEWGGKAVETGYVATITSKKNGLTKETNAFYDPQGNPGTIHITYADDKTGKTGSHDVDLRTKHIHETIRQPVEGGGQLTVELVANKRPYQAAITPHADVVWEKPFVEPNMEEFLAEDSRAGRLRHHLSTTYSYNSDPAILDRYRNWVTIKNQVAFLRGSIFNQKESPFTSTITKGFLHGFNKDVSNIKQSTSVFVTGPSHGGRKRLRSGDISFVTPLFELKDLSKYEKSKKGVEKEKTALSDITTLIQTLDR